VRRLLLAVVALMLIQPAWAQSFGLITLEEQPVIRRATGDADLDRPYRYVICTGTLKLPIPRGWRTARLQGRVGRLSLRDGSLGKTEQAREIREMEDQEAKDRTFIEGYSKKLKEGQP